MDNNNQNQEGQQLQIDLSPEIAKGVYTNFQIISHSSSEFVLDLRHYFQESQRQL